MNTIDDASNGVKSDETLVDAHRKGDSTALDILLRRYEVILRNFILSFSWLASPDTIDDIIQEISITVFDGIREGGSFTAERAGDFKAWLLHIAKNHCFNINKKQAKQPRSISRQYLESCPAKLEEIRYYDEPDEPAKLEGLDEELKRILGQLSDEERQLLILKQEGKTYIEIAKIPPFDKYTPANLRRKVCDARNFVSGELEKNR